MPKLSDLQITILTTAAERADGSLLPLSDTQKLSPGIRRSITSLITRGFAAEGEGASVPDDAVWRTEGERQLGVTITNQGRTAIGVPVQVPAPAAADAPPTKIGQVTALLRRAGGATVDELIAVTGWLPHTTRAALTGLRKKGHSIEKAKRDGTTTYMIATA